MSHIFEAFLAIPSLIVLAIVGVVAYFYFTDKLQKQHSVRRTHPLAGRLRTMFEMIGPELRQYFIWDDKQGRPIDRDTQTSIAKAGKYGSTIKGFGSSRDNTLAGLYLSNSMFPKNTNELQVNNEKIINTFKYNIKHEGLMTRHEERLPGTIEPWYLKNKLVVGENSENPWELEGFIGVSAMSYGALSDVAVQALAQGVAISGGSWMVTGEGGISPYHLSKIYQINLEKVDTAKFDESTGKFAKLFNYIKKSIVVSNFEIEKEFGKEIFEQLNYMVEDGFIIEKSTDLIFQIGSGLFGARDKNENKPTFSPEAFVQNASRPEVKAIEIKLAQGAKTKGGHMEGKKVTPEIAEIRGVKPYETIESPNRFRQFDDIDSLFDFIKQLKELSKKPVGIKVVIGSDDSLDDIAYAIKSKGFGPDFITVDGGEGGTGATYQGMADSMGLPIYSAIMIADDSLKKYGVRDKVKIFASGLLATDDKMAIALALGADFINVARAAMNTIGCINAMKCHSNECPTGVTTHNPKLKKGLVVEEKRFRTANYLATMRKEVFSLSAACGVDSPTKLKRNHVTFKDSNYKTSKL